MYTSGRNVKSSKAQRSPIQVATATGRRLAKRHLGERAEFQVDSRYITGLDNVTRLRTQILFREMPHEASKPLADAVTELPGYSSMAWNLVSVSYMIEI